MQQPRSSQPRPLHHHAFEHSKSRQLCFTEKTAPQVRQPIAGTPGRYQKHRPARPNAPKPIHPDKELSLLNKQAGSQHPTRHAADLCRNSGEAESKLEFPCTNKQALLFLKKKKQKDFCSCGRWQQHGQTKTSFSVRLAAPFLRPGRLSKSAARRAGQGSPKATAQRREAPLTRPSTARQSGPPGAPTPWWRWTESNRRPPACKAGALPIELHPQSIEQRLVGQGGLEPPTPRLSSVCSNQLSY